MGFTNEPVGAEAAIGWHLRQIDHWDHQETLADAFDMGDAACRYEQLRKSHSARLAELESEFPETAKIARADLMIEHQAISDMDEGL